MCAGWTLANAYRECHMRYNLKTLPRLGNNLEHTYSDTQLLTEHVP